MINIDKLAIMANRKEDENLRFITYLKGHADPYILDKQFKELHENILKYIIVKIVGIVARN